MKWMSKKAALPLGILVLAIIIFAILLIAKKSHQPIKSEAPSWNIQSQILKQQDLAPQAILYGIVQTHRYTKIEASITAKVVATPKLAGTFVKKGELIIQLNDHDSRIIYAQRLADVQQLKAEIKSENARHHANLISLAHEKSVHQLTGKELNRYELLAKKKYISASDLDKVRQTYKRQELIITKRTLQIQNHKHQLEQINAKLNRAKALLEKAELNITRTKITAPFDGQITKLLVSVGSSAKPGEVLIEMYDHKALEIKTQIPQRWLPIISAAHKKKVSMSAYAYYDRKSYPLKLARIGGMIDMGKGALECLLTLPEDAHLPVGATLKILVNLPIVNNVFAVPATAIYNSTRAYKVVDGKLQTVNITVVGHRYTKDENRVLLIKSKHLKNDDVLMTSHLPNAINGLKVNETNEKNAH